MSMDRILFTWANYTLNYCRSQIGRMLRIQILTLFDGVNILKIDPLGQELYEGIHLDHKQRIFIYPNYILELSYWFGIIQLANNNYVSLIFKELRNIWVV